MFIYSPKNLGIQHFFLVMYLVYKKSCLTLGRLKFSVAKVGKDYALVHLSKGRDLKSNPLLCFKILAGLSPNYLRQT